MLLPPPDHNARARRCERVDQTENPVISTASVTEAIAAEAPKDRSSAGWGFRRHQKSLGANVMGLEGGTRARTARNTAEAFASLRAAGSSVRDDQVRNPDYLASRFIALGPRLTTLVKVPALRPLARRAAEPVSPGAYYYELARVKHIDCVLSEELELGIEQLVILGAGFDTRAYRFAEQLSSVRVYELDHPVTAALKQARVRRVFGRLPDHVSCSSIVFDYHYQGFTDGTGDYYRYGACEGRRRVDELGEPCILGIEEGELPVLLERDETATRLGLRTGRVPASLPDPQRRQCRWSTVRLFASARVPTAASSTGAAG